MLPQVSKLWQYNIIVLSAEAPDIVALQTILTIAPFQISAV